MAGAQVMGTNQNYPINYAPFNIKRPLDNITGKITSKWDMEEKIAT